MPEEGADRRETTSSPRNAYPHVAPVNEGWEVAVRVARDPTFAVFRFCHWIDRHFVDARLHPLTEVFVAFGRPKARAAAEIHDATGRDVAIEVRNIEAGLFTTAISLRYYSVLSPACKWRPHIVPKPTPEPDGPG